MSRPLIVWTVLTLVFATPGFGLRVAIENSPTSQGRNQYGSPPSNAIYEIKALCEAQGWTATIVGGSQVDEPGELANYDALVTGDIGYNDDDFSVYESALLQWIRNGGGFVSLGWMVYSTPVWSKMDTCNAVMETGGYSWASAGGQVRILNGGHPITQGVSNFTIQSHGEFPTGGLWAGAVQLGDYDNATGRVSIGYKTLGNGRSVYLGPVYFATFGGYANRPYYSDANARRLLKQAIEWVGQRHDVGVTKMLAPGAISDTNVSVVPACSVYNYGTQPETYDVRFKIGVYEQTKTVTTHAPGTYQYVEFTPAWVPTALGNQALMCSTELGTDADFSNNKKTGTTFVRKRDVGVVSLTAPSGMYTPGYVLQPIATWRNYGNTNADFEAWMLLSDPSDARVYAEKVTLSGVAPGPIQVSSFPTKQLNAPGPWTARCSTYQVGDVNSANDLLDRDFFVGTPDMAVSEIVAPAGTYDTNEVVTPSGKLHNDGNVNLPFSAWFIMNDPADGEVYRERIDVTGLEPGRDTTLNFPEHDLGEVEGDWTARCSVYVANDQDPTDNYADGTFRVRGLALWSSGWQEVAKHVPGATGVKDGGWLTSAVPASDANPLIYVAKGNKTTEFYSYDPVEDTWNTLGAINPDEGGRTKPPKKGCVGVSDGESYIYMTKGNNTLGFWKYSIIGDTWTRLPDVPVGPANKKVKGGGDLAYAVGVGETGWVYLMKGYKTEFYRYNTESSRWDTLDDVPYGVAPKYNAGSFLVHDGGQYLYAHQAKYTDAAKVHHYMFRYDLAGQKWDDTLAGMPVSGKDGGKMKLKKSKDGGSGAWYDGSLYALKGGNTCQFYKYAPAPGDTWTELDTIASFGSTAKKKKVKAGGDLAAYGRGAFFATKGNKTYEFWRYVQPTACGLQPTARIGVMAGPSTIFDVRFSISPNPITSSFATIRYAIPKAGPVAISVFDVAGRSVHRQTLMTARTGAASIDLRKLANGVYLVRFDADGYSTSRKLAVQR